VTDAAAAWLGVPREHPFGLHNLPYASFTVPGEEASRVGVRVGDAVLDVAAAAGSLAPGLAPVVAGGTLDRLLASGPAGWQQLRSAVAGWLSDPALQPVLEPLVHRLDDVRLGLPFTVADYVDFYASKHHASNVGRILRPGQEPLPPNWKHMPIGYHGRAGTVVVSGTPVVRPTGQRREPDGRVVVGPTARLDLEAELGFVVGVPSVHGHPVPLRHMEQHVFGVCLVNDWSARDVQAWEYVPLGPFLGKSFATSVSPWVVPLAALDAARVRPPARDVPPPGYLDDADAPPGGFDVRFEVRLNGTVVSRPPFAGMYWTAAQQLAHLTVNGASLRTGDLFASGTVSGAGPDELGSLLELTTNGREPLALDDGTSRSFLEDGDEVVVAATAPGPGGRVVGLGEVSGRVQPAVRPG
jgi:fumarylacetoacetase